MMETTTYRINYGGPEITKQLETWVRLEPGYDVDDQAAGLDDLAAMLAAVQSGDSALLHVSKSCVGLSATADTVLISLPFYVWPSSLDLDYQLSPSTGTLSARREVEIPRSFDLIVNGDRSVSLDSVFRGDLAEEMGPFDLSGGVLEPLTPEITGSVATTPVACFGIWRADGLSYGYGYELTVEIEKTAEGSLLSITDFAPTVAVSYIKADGSSGGDSIDLPLPSCMQALLAACDNGLHKWQIGCKGSRCDGLVYRMYFSSCSGQPILGRWEKR